MLRLGLIGLLVSACLVLGSLPVKSLAGSVDLMLTSSLIRFSEETLYAGDTVRIYATIKNLGDLDSMAQVLFYRSNILIGESQTISVLAGGADDVYVDYTLPEGSFNIRAVIQGADPADSNPTNDEAITPLFSTIADDDRDGVANTFDNCPEHTNTEQLDFDNDQQGDDCDDDIDNDGAANEADELPYDSTKIFIEPVIIVTQSPASQPLLLDDSETESVESNMEQSLESLPVTDEVNSQTRMAATESEATNEVWPIFGNTGAVNSLGAQFSYKQINWRSYEFIAVPPLGGEEYAVTWDFGDGATSAQPTINHTFPSPGVYMVTLGTVSPDGTVSTDSTKLTVSFFHLANPVLLLTLGALGMIIGGLTLLIYRLRRGEQV